MPKINDICDDELMDMLFDCYMWDGSNSALSRGDELVISASGLGPHRFGDEYISGYSRYILFRTPDHFLDDRVQCVMLIEE